MSISIPVKTRDEWRNTWLQFYKDYYTETDGTPIPVDVGPGSYPWARASAMAGVLAMQSAVAQGIALGHLLDSLSGDELDEKYDSRLPRIRATNSSGYITIECGSAGTTPVSGDTLVHGATGKTYATTGATALYQNGDPVPVESVDPGLGQDLAPGSVLTWTTPRAGCYSTCLVRERETDKGLFGGREAESDEEYRARIRAFNANPAGNMNEGELLVLIEESSPNEAMGRPGHGVPVEKGFVYPAIQGPGTCGMAFTVKSDELYGSRAPSSGQMTTVLNYVTSYASARDMFFLAVILPQTTNVDISVALSSASVNWAEVTPWPAWRNRSDGSMLTVSVAADAFTFTVAATSGIYTGVTPPVTGNTIAVYDSTLGVFRKKKILSVSGSGPWSLTINQEPAYSDTTFIPIVGKCICPWFDAINDVAASVLKSLAAQGPGEMTAHDPGDGKRMKRIPAGSPRSWPQTISSRIANDVLDNVPSVESSAFIGASVTSPSVGSTSSVYLLTLSDLGIFKT